MVDKGLMMVKKLMISVTIYLLYAKSYIYTSWRVYTHMSIGNVEIIDKYMQNQTIRSLKPMFKVDSQVTPIL